MRAIWTPLVEIVIVAAFLAGCVPAQPLAPTPRASETPAAALQPSPQPSAAPAAAAVVQPSAAPAAATADFQPLLRSYEDAFNRHDLDALLATQTSDACFAFLFAQTSGCGPKLRDIYGYLFELNTRLHFTGCQAQESLVSCNLGLQDDCLRAAGTDEKDLGEVNLTYADGKFTNVATKPGHAEIPEMAIIDDWSKANHPQEWKQMEQGGDFPANRETGAIGLRLCQAYAAAKAGATSQPTP